MPKMHIQYKLRTLHLQETCLYDRLRMENTASPANPHVSPEAAEAALKAILQSNPELLIKVAQPIQNCKSVEEPISKDFSLSKYRISKRPSPKAKISANISKNPANEKGLDQSKCLLTVQLLLASTKPANACGVRDCGTPGVTRTRYIPLRSYNIRVVPCSTPCFKMSANPHEYRIFYRTACCRVFGSIA